MSDPAGPLSELRAADTVRARRDQLGETGAGQIAVVDEALLKRRVRCSSAIRYTPYAAPSSLGGTLNTAFLPRRRSSCAYHERLGHVPL